MPLLLRTLGVAIVTLTLGATLGLPTTAGGAVVPPLGAVVAPPVGASGSPPVEQIEIGVSAVDEATSRAERGSAPNADVVADISAGGAVQTPVVTTGEFALVGMTWDGNTAVEDLSPQVRVRTDDGWSEWMDLEPSDGAADVGTADAVNERGAAEPIWVKSADAVQARFRGDDEPGAVRLELVDSGEDPGTVAPAVYRPAAAITPAAFGAVSALPLPTIVMRAEWGADESLRTVNAGCEYYPEYSDTMVAAVIHHTATGNDYATPAEARAVIRSIQRYHVLSRGWCDIGYNFLVDRWGYVYEARLGGIDKPVLGVHAGGFNADTVGVAMLGTFSSAGPSAEQQAAVADIVAWRLGAYGRAPGGTVTYTTRGGENSRYAAGSVVTLPVVFGHRDVAYTDCPGGQGYAALPGVRARAAARVSYEPFVKALYQDLLGRGADPTGLSTWATLMSQNGSRQQVIEGIAASDEYLSRRIAHAYRTVLGRDVDPSGAATWLDAVRRGAIAIDELPRRLMSSAEFQNKAGAGDEAFIAYTYQQILGRAAGASEETFWVGQIANRGRESVMSSIWSSVESSRRRVLPYYVEYLGRQADPSGVDHWAGVLGQRGEAAIRAGILASDEYYRKAAPLTA